MTALIDPLRLITPAECAKYGRGAWYWKAAARLGFLRTAKNQPVLLYEDQVQAFALEATEEQIAMVRALQRTGRKPASPEVKRRGRPPKLSNLTAGNSPARTVNRTSHVKEDRK